MVQAHRGRIHLLVSDVVMPEMHGPALSRSLAPLQPQMKVLYVSGYSENDISDQGVIDPDLDVLQKPFTQQSLVRKVRAILDEDRMAQLSASASK
jgi:FixJ family two-component response regulator